MTVQELIDILSEIKDKSKPINVYCTNFIIIEYDS